MIVVDSTHGSVWLWTLIALIAALVALALVNYAVARLAERRHPPTGAFLQVGSVRLHYHDQGTGAPIILLHGNAVSGDDFDTSGVAERLRATYRVIIFDRPGFGHSTRPRGQLWTASEQADLIHAALLQLGVQRAVVVGHSWGTLVALALAERHPTSTAGLVLISGYYFPTPRLDSLMVAPVATPVLGDILRYTISPLFGWMTMPAMKRAMFAPSAVTERFDREYSPAMALRPWQIRATASDGALMVMDASRLSGRYGALSTPVSILAGDGDKVVGPEQAQRLQRVVPSGTVEVIRAAGHMVHHVATERVVQVIEQLAKVAYSRGTD
ncbi:alpha/beta fold hydrolase [Methylobacterium durans]|uniref:Alpha/beta hydrolase n=1 Tax=Methylobacterium durans TaxID=2202825 RepID=A0A2U8W3T7_9HYPH|nr:alpha/beta hydrolase [Methylobacterium durans]AWN40764.1 alpha/beta hydrolase [Methylobacterium durans]